MRSRGHRRERRAPREAPGARGLPAIGGALAIALALTLGLSWVSEPSTASADDVKAMWGPASRDGASLFPVYRELSVKIYEEDLHWNLVAARRPRHPRNPRDRA